MGGPRRFYRAFFRAEDDAASNLMLDILIDEHRKLVSDVPLCGWWGILKSHSVWPFVLLGDRLDLGDDGEVPVLPDKERYAQLDIEDRIIAVGEFFTLLYNDQRWTLRLERLTDITAL